MDKAKMVSQFFLRGLFKFLGSSSSLSPSSSFLLALLVTSFCSSTTQAAKDNDYYYPSFVNPNAENAMYWKDSINVLQDLDQFESLYIRYHHCVWSKYGTRYGTGEDYDNQDDDDNDFENGCGGFGGGEYYWYMGRTQCFKANVAYSLYGVLKGQDPKMKKGSYCHSDSYINSFFTTFGTESFAGPMGLGTNAANSVCQSYQDNGGGGNGGDFSYAQVDDDYLGDDYSFYDATTYVSQGTGCSADGKFVRDQYSGPFCHGKDYESTLDEMEDFNAALQEMDCTEVYSASNNNNNGEDRNRNRELEEEDYDYDYDFSDLPAYKILAFSKSCSIAQYPHDCPDPYGHKRRYSNAIQRALAYKTGRYRDLGTIFVRSLSWLFFATGLLFLGGIYYLNQQQDKDTRKQERRKRREQRKQAKAANNDDNNKRNSSRSYDDDDETSNVLERGIESTISNTSGTSSKKSSGSRSCLRKPKIKLLPKKFRRGNNGSGSAKDYNDEEITITTSEARGIELTEGGEIVDTYSVTESSGAPWMDGFSVADTSLAESQIYMTENEEGFYRALTESQSQATQKVEDGDEDESSYRLPGYFAMGAVSALGTLTTTSTNDVTRSRSGTGTTEDQVDGVLTTTSTNVTATEEEEKARKDLDAHRYDTARNNLMGVAAAGSSVSASSAAPLGIAASSMSAPGVAAKASSVSAAPSAAAKAPIEEQQLQAERSISKEDNHGDNISLGIAAAAGIAALTAAAAISSTGTAEEASVEQELQGRSNSMGSNRDKSRSLGITGSSVSASSSAAKTSVKKHGSYSRHDDRQEQEFRDANANETRGNHLETASASSAAAEFTVEAQVDSEYQESINPGGGKDKNTESRPVENQDPAGRGISSASYDDLLEEANNKGRGRPSNGYITLEDLLDEAASLVTHTSVGSFGDDDLFASALGKKTTTTALEVPRPENTEPGVPRSGTNEPVISPAHSVEWGMPPVLEGDESTTSGASNYGMAKAGAATAAVAGTAALVAAASSSSSKSKSKFPSRLRALIPVSPSRRAEIARAKLKNGKEQQAQPTPTTEKQAEQAQHEQEPTEKEDSKFPPALPVPVTPVASGEDAFSDLDTSGRNLPNGPSQKENDVPIGFHSDDEYDQDQLELDPEEQVEMCLEDYEIYSDDETATAEKDEADDEEAQEDYKEEEGLAEPPRISPKKRNKMGGFFRRNPKSPENTKSLRGLFGKPPKTLSPTQMATAPPLVLVTPPSTNKTKSRKLKSQPATLQKRFFSKKTNKQKLKKQKVAEDAQQLPVVVVNNEQEEDEQEGELNINANKSASFDLIGMIDIIEPVIPPESQKDLYCATPPASQKKGLGMSSEPDE